MKKENIALGLGILAFVIAVWTAVPLNSVSLSGTTNYDVVDASGGFTVDGTTVIDGSGVVTTADGAFSDDLTVGDDLTVTGELTNLTKTTAITGAASGVTLTAAQSGTTFSLQRATGTVITLPATSTTGMFFRFVVSTAFATDNYVIDSAEGDNIEGTLIVAGAVVDCRGEDQINLVADGEALGDYVELYSDGIQWTIVDSGVLTASKMTCTDPS